MLCPVCKTECKTSNYCKECGFDDIAPSFLSKEDVEIWQKTVVEPYRKHYWTSLTMWTIEGNAVINSDSKGRKKMVIPYGIQEIKSGAGLSRTVKKLIIPNTVKKIEARTFAHNNIEEVNFPEGLEDIGEYAFNSCPLKEVVLPSTIQYLGDHCIDAEEIHISSENKHYFIENNCLIERQSGKLLRVSNKNANQIVIPDGVKTIGVYAFSGCEHLKQIVIPESVEQILRGAFFKCRELKCIILPKNINLIERYVFEQCYSLSDIYFDFNEWQAEFDEQWLDACGGLARLHWKND